MAKVYSFGSRLAFALPRGFWLASSVGLVSLAIAPAVSAQGPALACDSARAIGHIKRVTGANTNVTIERAQGGVKRLPTPLTPICAADRIKVRGATQVVLDLYGGSPVTVTRVASWTAPTVQSRASVTGNVWAYFVDKLAPDVGRVQTQHRTRGSSNGPPTVLIAGVQSQTAKLYLEDLTGPLRVPISGWAGVQSAKLIPLDTTRETVPGLLNGAPPEDTTRSLIFTQAPLRPGRYQLIVQTPTDAGQGAVSAEVTLGQIEILAGKAPSLQTQPGQSPYDPATQKALQALWLAQTRPGEHALMAYQLSPDAPDAGLTKAMVQRLILSYGRP